jgi:flagellar protein FlbD
MAPDARAAESPSGRAAVIVLTRLDRSEFVLNAEFIQTVESKPDTHIVLFNGHSYVVLEERDEVIRRVLDYRRAVYGGVARPPLTLLKK